MLSLFRSIAEQTTIIHGTNDSSTCEVRVTIDLVVNLLSRMMVLAWLISPERRETLLQTFTYEQTRMDDFVSSLHRMFY